MSRRVSRHSLVRSMTAIYKGFAARARMVSRSGRQERRSLLCLQGSRWSVYPLLFSLTGMIYRQAMNVSPLVWLVRGTRSAPDTTAVLPVSRGHQLRTYLYLSKHLQQRFQEHGGCASDCNVISLLSVGRRFESDLELLFCALPRLPNAPGIIVFGSGTVMVASGTPCCYWLAFPDHPLPFGGRPLEAIALLWLTRFAFPPTSSA